MTEEPRAWQARTQSADAEVYGAISPSTVTNSGLLWESVDKHSISTRRRPASCPRSPPHLSPRAPWRSGSLMIECGYTRSVSRDVLAHAGVPHHAVHACHARRVAWFLRRRSQLWRWEPSFPTTISRGRAAPLSRASCTSCLAAPPLANICARTRLWPPAPSRPSGGEAQCSHPLSVQYLRGNRSPGVDEEGRGEGHRRCGGRDHVVRRDGYAQRFYHLCRHDRVGNLAEP